jgi:hypothetical protein
LWLSLQTKCFGALRATSLKLSIFTGTPLDRWTV